MNAVVMAMRPSRRQLGRLHAAVFTAVAAAGEQRTSDWSRPSEMRHLETLGNGNLEQSLCK